MHPITEEYDLHLPEWKYDAIPEIMDGKNIADFIDPDILEVCGERALLPVLRNGLRDFVQSRKRGKLSGVCSALVVLPNFQVVHRGGAVGCLFRVCSLLVP